jgi:hypothetical protein
MPRRTHKPENGDQRSKKRKLKPATPRNIRLHQNARIAGKR